MRSALALFMALNLALAALAKLDTLPLAIVARSRHGHRILNDNRHHLNYDNGIVSTASSRFKRRSNLGARRLDRSLDVTALLSHFSSLCGQAQASQQSIHSSRLDVEKDTTVGATKRYSHAVSNQLAAMRSAAGGSTPIISNLDKLLGPFGSGEGKEYYDKTSAFQTLLKDFIDSNKYMLADIDYIIYRIPGLGPIFGPIVYDIKCLVEDLLNGLENSTDGLLAGQGLVELQDLLTGLNLFRKKL